MYGLCVGLVDGVYDFVDDDIGLVCGWWVDMDGFIGYFYMQCILVGIGIDGDCFDFYFVGCFDDLVGDFILVGDQDFLE